MLTTRTAHSNGQDRLTFLLIGLTGASFIDPETGIVDVNKDLCVGCQYCIAVCPYRVRFIHPVHRTADKCNFCRDTNLAAGKQPACVEACPTKALTFGDMNDPTSAVARKVKQSPVYRTKVELGTQPNLYHIPFIEDRKSVV